MRAEAVDDEPEYAPPPRRGGRDDDYDDGGDEPYVRKPKSAWGMVSIGLLIVFIAFCVVAGAHAVTILGDLLGTIGLAARSNLFMTGGNIHRIGELIFALVVLGTIPGYIMCILGPNKGGTMPLAITTASVTGVYVIMWLIARFAMAPNPFDGGGMTGQWIMMLLSQLLFCASIILFPLYLQAVLQARKRSRYANPMGAMTLAIVYAGVFLVGNILVYVLASSAGLSMGILWASTLVQVAIDGVMVAFLINYILLLWNVRALIS